MRLRNWVQTAFVIGQFDSTSDCKLNLLVIILQGLELTEAKPFLICMPGARSLKILRHVLKRVFLNRIQKTNLVTSSLQLLCIYEFCTCH